MPYIARWYGITRSSEGLGELLSRRTVVVQNAACGIFLLLPGGYLADSVARYSNSSSRAHTPGLLLLHDSDAATTSTMTSAPNSASASRCRASTLRRASPATPSAALDPKYELPLGQYGSARHQDVQQPGFQVGKGVAHDAYALLAEQPSPPAAARRDLLADFAEVEWARLGPGSSDVQSVVDALVEAHGLRAGCIVVDTTSGIPAVSKAIAERLSSIGVDYLDFGVAGGPSRAAAARLSGMVGGWRRRCGARCRSSNSCNADAVHHMLERRVLGHAVKAVNNMLLAANIATLRPRRRRCARRASRRRRRSRRSTRARGTVTEERIPKHVLSGNFDFGFRLDLMMKGARAPPRLLYPTPVRPPSPPGHHLPRLGAHLVDPPPLSGRAQRRRPDGRHRRRRRRRRPRPPARRAGAPCSARSRSRGVMRSVARAGVGAHGGDHEDRRGGRRRRPPRGGAQPHVYAHADQLSDDPAGRVRQLLAGAGGAADGGDGGGAEGVLRLRGHRDGGARDHEPRREQRPPRRRRRLRPAGRTLQVGAARPTARPSAATTSPTFPSPPPPPPPAPPTSPSAPRR